MIAPLGKGFEAFRHCPLLAYDPSIPGRHFRREWGSPTQSRSSRMFATDDTIDRTVLT